MQNRPKKEEATNRQNTIRPSRISEEVSLLLLIGLVQEIEDEDRVDFED